MVFKILSAFRNNIKLTSRIHYLIATKRPTKIIKFHIFLLLIIPALKGIYFALSKFSFLEIKYYHSLLFVMISIEIFLLHIKIEKT